MGYQFKVGDKVCAKRYKGDRYGIIMEISRSHLTLKARIKVGDADIWRELSLLRLAGRLEGPAPTLNKSIRRTAKELTLADIRRDCFPKSYTWWTEQPEKIEVVDPRYDKVRGLVDKVLGKEAS